jgi:uncharacterized membrane protein YdjX (TVP38/TMEM64 family)
MTILRVLLKRDNCLIWEIRGEGITLLHDQILQYFETYRSLAILISIAINIIIAIAGVIPTVFVTGANLAFFGFWKGFLVSLAGEIIGANVAFYLYRKGFKKVSANLISKYPKVEKLVNSEGLEAFYLILLLRVLPFMPSGLVTYSGAVGTVSLGIFTAANALGKIPALLIEAFSVYQVMKVSWLAELLIQLGLVYIIYSLWKKIKK